MRTLLAIRQMSRKQSFWKVILFCFIDISKYGSFLQDLFCKQLLAWLILTLDAEDWFCWYKGKKLWQNNIAKLWQQHTQLKTMEMNEAWSDIYNNGLYQLQPAPIHKIQ